MFLHLYSQRWRCFGRASTRFKAHGWRGSARARTKRRKRSCLADIQCFATSRQQGGQHLAGISHTAQDDRHRNPQRCSRPRPWRPQHPYVPDPPLSFAKTLSAYTDDPCYTSAARVRSYSGHVLIHSQPQQGRRCPTPSCLLHTATPAPTSSFL